MGWEGREGGRERAERRREVEWRVSEGRTGMRGGEVGRGGGDDVYTRVGSM